MGYGLRPGICSPPALSRHHIPAPLPPRGAPTTSLYLGFRGQDRAQGRQQPRRPPCPRRCASAAAAAAAHAAPAAPPAAADGGGRPLSPLPQEADGSKRGPAVTTPPDTAGGGAALPPSSARPRAANSTAPASARSNPHAAIATAARHAGGCSLSRPLKGGPGQDLGRRPIGEDHAGLQNKR